MRKSNLTVVGLASLALCGVAMGDGQDIGVASLGGRLLTIAVEGEPPVQVFGESEVRVFAADLEWNPSAGIVVIDEPGYASRDGGLLGRSFTFDLLAAAREWNGSSFVATTRTLGTGLPDLGLPFINTPATDVTVPGYSWNLSDDFHFEWSLNGATDTTGQGIYLAQLQLRTSGFDATSPFWIVFNYGQSELEHDAAIDWVQTTLVPAPGAGVLIAMGGLLALRRRRA